MEIKVYHNNELIMKCDVWKLILMQLLNRPIQIMDIDELKVFVNNVEIPKPENMENDR